MNFTDKELYYKFKANSTDIDVMNEIVKRWCQQQKELDEQTAVGDTIYYVDFDRSEIEKGIVDAVHHDEGKVSSLTINWVDKDGNYYDVDIIDLDDKTPAYYYFSEYEALNALNNGEKAALEKAKAKK